MKNYKVAIAGFGKIGQLRAKEINLRSDSELVAYFDIKQPKGNFKGEYCKTFDELLSHNPDVIFICAYNNVLAEYTIESLNRGIHVFCEKPPARNTQELVKVKNAKQINPDTVLKYGFNHRYHYSVIEAKKIIDSGELGKMLWLRGVYGKAGSIDYDKNWRNYKKYSGGGILIDQGIHMLDLMRYFSGEHFSKINSFVTTSYWNIEAEDNAFAIMQSDNQVTATIHSSATQWRHKFLLEMCFEEGYINLDGILSGTRSYAPEMLVVGRREFEDITHAMGKPKESVTWFEYDNSWKMEVDEFYNAINHQEPIKNGTIDDAYETLRLVERIYERSGF
jgi:predicted dehydrogenase